MKNMQTGFSLMELIIAIAIGGILSAILIPSFRTTIQKAHSLTKQMQSLNATNEPAYKP